MHPCRAIALSLSLFCRWLFFTKRSFAKISELYCRGDRYHSLFPFTFETTRTLHAWMNIWSESSNRETAQFYKVIPPTESREKSNFCLVTSLRNLFRNIAWKYQDTRNENLTPHVPYISVWIKKLKRGVYLDFNNQLLSDARSSAPRCSASFEWNN